MSGREEALAAVLREHPRTYAEIWGIDLRRPTAGPLFRLLCGALLASARIRSSIATEALKGLAGAGWTTADRMRRAPWERRVAVLHEAGYTRYQERTATMLGEAAGLLLDRYRGDLRRLRDRARRDREAERGLLQEIPGMGRVGADIFLREVQVAWPEVRPYADRRALAAARKRGLPGSTRELARLAGERDFHRVVAALVQSELEA